MNIKLKCSLIYAGDRFLLSGKKSYQLPYINDEKISQFLHALSVGLPVDQVKEYLCSEKLKSLYSVLEKEQLLTVLSDDHRNTSLEKTYEYFCYHLGNLRSPFNFKENLHIAIVGCGGTGANVALCLASSGFGSFTLVDCDTVQKSNLNRQFAYDSRDVGKSKVVCLRKKLQQINPELNISILEKKITDTHDLDALPGNIDLIVSAIDYPAVHSSIFTTKYAIKCDIPIIFGAVGYECISVGPLLTHQASRYSYLESLMKVANIDTQPVTGSLSSTNLTLSSMLATNITTWFYPFSQTDLRDVRKIYNAASMALVSVVNYGHY